MRSFVEKVKRRINEYPRISALIKLAEHTPRYVIHWYILLLLGVVVGVVLIILAWTAFVGTTNSSTTPLPSTGAGVTFNQKELQEILDTYKTQDENFEALKRTVPSVIDPGR